MKFLLMLLQDFMKLGKAFQLNWEICLLSLVFKGCHRLLALLKGNHQISGIA